MDAATKTPSTFERWVSVDDTVKHLGIRKETLYRWIERRGLPACRLGRHWKFKLSEVDAWVRSGAAAGPADGTDGTRGMETKSVFDSGRTAGEKPRRRART